MPDPSTNDSNGRDERGHFAKGNPGGPGNPFARRVAELRKEMLASITDRDIREIIGALLKSAKRGDLGAAKLVLSYCIGQPSAAPNPDEVDERERAIEEARDRPVPAAIKALEKLLR